MKVFTGDDGKIHVFSGDVAGHGVESGKVSVRLKQALSERSPGLAAEGTGAADWLAALEPDLHTPAGNSTMAMMSHVALDPVSGEAEVATAGQNLVYRMQPDGTVTRLNTGGAPLGIGMEDSISGTKVQLGQGDMVVAVSDGAYSRFGDDFGERFEQHLNSLGPNTTPQQISNDIFSRTARKPDDTSVMILRWPTTEY